MRPSSSCFLFVALYADTTSSLTVTSLHRYAVKGLSGDALDRVELKQPGDTFPDDRRFALLLDRSREKWKDDVWLHKENFLCAFSDPEFLAQFESSYEIVTASTSSLDEQSMTSSLEFAKVNLRSISEPSTTSSTTQRLLTVRRRSTGETLLDQIDLQQESGRRLLGDFFSHTSQKQVHCITSARNDAAGSHKHQFGNTSSGYKQRNDTRTIHIINQATVDLLAKTFASHALKATRFRPNIVVSGAPAWSEFDWIGKKLVEDSTGLTLTVISKTVRCKGVSVDPTEVDGAVMNIPSLLVQHFPEHGPYLGVYAVADVPGSIQIGSRFTIQDT
jgi:hypothetical protein